MGELRVMGRAGDLRVTWDPTNALEVGAARRQFDDLRSQGYLAYTPTKEGKGEIVTTFDPEAGRIIMAPPMQGG